MSVLAANIGNSTLRFALFDDAGTIVANIRLPSDPAVTADAIAALLLGALSAQRRADALGAVDGICVASVVPTLDRPLQEFCRAYLPQAPEPLVVHGAMDIDMPVRYDPPASLGADRLVNAYAARVLYGAPVIAADFGTATTFEAVDADGAYLGGAILPGVGTGRDALAAKTALLRRINLDDLPEIRAIGTDTVSALRAGIVVGAAAQAEGMITRFRAEIGASEARVVATGGFAAMVARQAPAITVVDPDLTVKGLYRIYQRSRGRCISADGR